MVHFMHYYWHIWILIIHQFKGPALPHFGQQPQVCVCALTAISLNLIIWLQMGNIPGNLDDEMDEMEVDQVCKLRWIFNLHIVTL